MVTATTPTPTSRRSFYRRLLAAFLAWPYTSTRRMADLACREQSAALPQKQSQRPAPLPEPQATRRCCSVTLEEGYLRAAALAAGLRASPTTGTIRTPTTTHFRPA